MNKMEPKIYVICLSAHKQGVLHGAWIDANQSVDALYAAVQSMLASSPVYDAELFAIHDNQGFGSVKIKKYTSLEEISALASVISYLREKGMTALCRIRKEIYKYNAM